MKPASALPWYVTTEGGSFTVAELGSRAHISNYCGDDDQKGAELRDAQYAVHAANLYPELVEALRKAARFASMYSARPGLENSLAGELRALLAKCEG